MTKSHLKTGVNFPKRRVYKVGYTWYRAVSKQFCVMNQF